MSGVEINTSKLTLPEFISLIKSSDPDISAPEVAFQKPLKKSINQLTPFQTSRAAQG